MQDKLSRAEVSVENLRQERVLLKQVEARLQSENESLNRERSGQALVLANLQAIQVYIIYKEIIVHVRYLLW